MLADGGQLRLQLSPGDEHDASPQGYLDPIAKLEAAAAKTQSPAMQFLLGYHHGFRGDSQRAVADLEQGLKLEPNDPIMRRLRDYLQQKRKV